jgi:hypothetical protein
MDRPFQPATRVRGALLVADISGYTGFLQGVADAHRAIIVEADEPPAAYAVVSSLLEAIADELSPPFELAKFEGDAVFAVASDATWTARGPAVVGCLRSCHAAFARRLEEARAQWSCVCDACARIGDLDLRFVLHHGEYVVQRVAGRDEILGAEVNAVHRLLKNHAREVVGERPYALITDATLEALEVPTDGMAGMTETYDDLPPIPVHVLALDRP